MFEMYTDLYAIPFLSLLLLSTNNYSYCVAPPARSCSVPNFACFYRDGLIQSRQISKPLSRIIINRIKNSRCGYIFHHFFEYKMSTGMF